MSTSVAAFSYAIAGGAFLFLTTLFCTARPGRLRKAVFATPCMLSAAWALWIAYYASRAMPLPITIDLLEILRDAGWTFFLLVLLAPLLPSGTFMSIRIKPVVAAISALYSIVLLAYLYFHLGFYTGAYSLTLDVGTRLALAIMGLVLVEQLYRNTPQKERWAIKFACIGIGGIFAYDFYLYSDALLLRYVNDDIWSSRGLMNALAVPLIAISSARNPRWSVGISVSRSVLFHSVTLVGCSVYLLAMASAAYYLRFFGGSWGPLMQAAFLSGSLILLIAVLFSGSVRSTLKVFISKHFFNYNYDYREEWLHFTRTLSETGPSLGEKTVQAIAELVESPGGTLYVRRDEDCCEPVAHWNVTLGREIEPLDGSLCRFLERKKWVIDLQQLVESPDMYDGLAAPQWLLDQSKARLVVPLFVQEKLFGFIVLAQPRSRIKLNWEIIDLLKIAGRQAASHMAQQEAHNALLVARQFESFNRMSTFIVHDLKNLLSQLSFLMSNAQKHKDNAEFQADMVETIEHSVRKMKSMLERLSRPPDIEKPVPLSLEEVLQRAVVSKAGYGPRPELEIRDAGLMVVADQLRLERVLSHLVQNAMEATPSNGRVVARLMREGESARIELEDTGKGMSEEFIRERLFKPFESTKSAGMGIGVFESRAYIRELGGQITVESRQSAGTTFRILLPLYEHDTGMAMKFG